MKAGIILIGLSQFVLVCLFALHLQVGHPRRRP